MAQTGHIARVLRRPGVSGKAYCGRVLRGHHWVFQSKEHAIASLGRSTTRPCERCLKVIEKEDIDRA